LTLTGVATIYTFLKLEVEVDNYISFL
jgi:hypothetical protein